MGWHWQGVLAVSVVLLGSYPTTPAAHRHRAAPRTLCVCQPRNDLFRLLQPPPDLYHNLSAALASRPKPGDALLVLADGYPTQPTDISPAQYAAIAAAGVRVFVEFPATLPASSALNLSSSMPQALDQACGISAGPSHNGGDGLGSSSISRVVIATNATMGHGLAPMRILGIHGSVVMPTTLGMVQSCLPWPADKPRTVNTSVQVVLPTHLSALCARPTEQPPSHVEYVGVVCGTDGAIMWHNFSVKDVRSDLKVKQCSFTCAASPEFCGQCGGKSPKVPTLPSHLCSASNNGSRAGTTAPVIAVAARVAGYDHAVFGLPADGVAAILFEATDSALIATTSFSNVLQGRYGPVRAWGSLLRFVLAWIGSTLTLSPLVPRVRPAYSQHEALTSLVAAERKALEGAVAHLVDTSGLLYSSLSGTQRADLHKQCPVTTVPPRGKATACINEGFASVIDWRGNQPERNNTVSRRTDGDAYAALGIAVAGAVGKNQTRIEIGAAMIEYIFFWSGCQQRLQAGASRAEAADGSKGLVAWFPPQLGPALYYPSIDGAVFISGIALAGLLPSERQERWAEALLHQAFGNLRTTGLLGFRPGSTTQSVMKGRGWRSYFNSSMAANCGRDCTVGMQSLLWATYLWAGHHSGIALFGQRVYEATRQEMALWQQERWQCITTMSQQLVLETFVLSFLVRTNNTAESRGWLDSIATALISKQRPCGSIREYCNSAECSYGGGNSTKSCFCASNSVYGTGEGGIIQTNDDPAADLLYLSAEQFSYTQNFALMALNEAAMAVGLESEVGRRYMQAADKLSSFLVRAQVSSPSHPYLHGTWLRGFDVSKWEFWGSATDVSWGVFTTESGWTAGWVAAMMGLRQLNSSLWDAAAPFGATLNRTLARELCLRYFEGDEAPCAQQVAIE